MVCMYVQNKYTFLVLVDGVSFQNCPLQSEEWNDTWQVIKQLSNITVVMF